MRKRTMLGVLALACFSLVLASPATASHRLRLSTHAGPLPPGSDIELRADVQVLGFGVRLECSTSSMEGTVVVNEAQKDQLSLSSAEFEAPEEEGCLLPESTPVTPVDYLPVVAQRLPWTATLGANLALAITGSDGLELDLGNNYPEIPSCHYEAPRMSGFVETAAGLLFTLAAAQHFKLEPGSKCHSKGPANVNHATLNAVWVVTSGGEPVRFDVVK
jgi:hypothetical protein